MNHPRTVSFKALRGSSGSFPKPLFLPLRTNSITIMILMTLPLWVLTCFKPLVEAEGEVLSGRNYRHRRPDISISLNTPKDLGPRKPQQTVRQLAEVPTRWACLVKLGTQAVWLLGFRLNPAKRGGIDVLRHTTIGFLDRRFLSSGQNFWFRIPLGPLGVDSLSILFNHRSFQKPDPFPLGF